jgi:peptidoglycan/xylan/chitin deacetylase (PgdA/CDA1 family)
MSLLSFIRNDDVRGTLDDSLVRLTEKLVELGFPVSHAVEPANVSQPVVEWLLRVRQAYPEQLEIIQHGYDHRLKTPAPVRGEFGGDRPLTEQKAEIEAGRRIMDDRFGPAWTRAFSFPYGTYDLNTLRALEEIQFEMVSTGCAWGVRRRLLNAAGTLFRVRRVGRRMVHYPGRRIPGFALYEYPVVVNYTRKQAGPDSGLQRTEDELRAAWNRVPVGIKTRGILCHHRFHGPGDPEPLLEFLKTLRAEGVRFATLGRIHESVAHMRGA